MFFIKKLVKTIARVHIRQAHFIIASFTIASCIIVTSYINFHSLKVSGREELGVVGTSRKQEDTLSHKKLTELSFVRVNVTEMGRKLLEYKILTMSYNKMIGEDVNKDGITKKPQKLTTKKKNGPTLGSILRVVDIKCLNDTCNKYHGGLCSVLRENFLTKLRKRSYLLVEVSTITQTILLKFNLYQCLAVYQHVNYTSDLNECMKNLTDSYEQRIKVITGNYTNKNGGMKSKANIDDSAKKNLHNVQIPQSVNKIIKFNVTTNSRTDLILQYVTNVYNRYIHKRDFESIVIRCMDEINTIADISPPKISNSDYIGENIQDEHNKILILEALNMYLYGLYNVTRKIEYCDSCMDLKFSYFINPSNICDDHVHLLIVIFSAPGNSWERKAIRNSWGMECRNSSSRVKCVFVVAIGNKTDQKLLEEESGKHGDIIQAAFVDSYRNLTYKSVMSFKWAQKYCSNANYVMKTDDDMYINTLQIPKLLEKAPDTKFYGGFCTSKNRPHRDIKSKWYVSMLEYDQTSYPPFCTGTCYIMSNDVLHLITPKFKDINFLYLEDIYVAIAIEAVGVLPVDMKGFNNNQESYGACKYRYNVMSSHKVKPIELMRQWGEILNCSKNYQQRGVS